MIKPTVKSGDNIQNIAWQMERNKIFNLTQGILRVFEIVVGLAK